MATFDGLAERYDETRGGEQRGEAYAQVLHARLPARSEPVLEVGVGTGVVMLGLQRRGRRVVGVDVSAPMLQRARMRVGPLLVLGDACRLPLANQSVGHAYAVWVLHAVPSPVALFEEVARVVRPGGQFLVCPVNRPAPEDLIGRLLQEMFDAVRQAKGERSTVMDSTTILASATQAGWTGQIAQLPTQRWETTPQREIDALVHRSWSSLATLDDDQFATAVQPTVDRLRELPSESCWRCAEAQLVDLHREGGLAPVSAR